MSGWCSVCGGQGSHSVACPFYENPEVVKLKQQLVAVTKERDEALERIKKSQEQEPIYQCWQSSVGCWQDCSKIVYEGYEPDGYAARIVYKLRVIPPAEAELQSQLAAANSRINVLIAANVQQAEEIERLKEANSILSEELQATEGALKLSAKKYNQNSGVKDFVAVIAQRQIDELTKLLAEERKKAVPEWMPIETAPKDGQRILLWGFDGFDIVIGFWSSYHKPEHWCFSSETLYRTRGEPTHWMPLPAAPQPEDK